MTIGTDADTKSLNVLFDHVNFNSTVQNALVAGASGVHARFDLAQRFTEFSDALAGVLIQYANDGGFHLQEIMDAYKDAAPNLDTYDLGLAILELDMGVLGPKVPELLADLAGVPDAWRFVGLNAQEIKSLPLDVRWKFLHLMGPEFAEEMSDTQRALGLFLFDQVFKNETTTKATLTRNTRRIAKIITPIDPPKTATYIQECMTEKERDEESWKYPLQVGEDLAEIFRHFHHDNQRRLKEQIVATEDLGARAKIIAKLKILVAADTKFLGEASNQMPRLSSTLPEIYLLEGLELSDAQLRVLLEQPGATLYAMTLGIQNAGPETKIEFVGEWLHRGGGLEMFGGDQAGVAKTMQRYETMRSAALGRAVIDSAVDGATRDTVQRMLASPI